MMLPPRIMASDTHPIWHVPECVSVLTETPISHRPLTLHIPCSDSSVHAFLLLNMSIPTDERQPLLDNAPDLKKQPPGPRDISPSTRVGILVGVLDGQLSFLLASISSDFNKSNQASWLGTAYLLATCTFTPLYGRLCNVLGRKGANHAALFFAAAGCLMCGLSRSMEMLILARFLAGMGGGGLLTTTSVIISDMYSIRSRGLAQGVGSVFKGLGTGLGGPFGGMIADWLGWRWAFLLQLPFFFLSYVLTSYNLCYVTPGKGRSTKEILKRIDYGGSGTLLLCVGSILFYLSERYNNDKPWDSPTVMGSLIFAFVSAIAFLVMELYIAPEPILVPYLLKQKIPMLSGASNFLVANCNFAIMYFFPLWFQTVRLETASKAGAHLLPNSLAMSTGSVFAGWMMHKTGRYKMLNLTFGFFPFLGALAICFLSENSGFIQSWFSVIPLGFGNAVVLQTMLIALLVHLPESYVAVGTGFNTFFRGVGQVGGVAISSAIYQSKLNNELHARITGLGSERLINRIRRQAKLVALLPPEVQRPARDAYNASLKAVFLYAAISTFLAFLVRLPIPDKHLDDRPPTVESAQVRGNRSTLLDDEENIPPSRASETATVSEGNIDELLTQGSGDPESGAKRVLAKRRLSGFESQDVVADPETLPTQSGQTCLALPFFTIIKSLIALRDGQGHDATITQPRLSRLSLTRDNTLLFQVSDNHQILQIYFEPCALLEAGDSFLALWIMFNAIAKQRLRRFESINSFIHSPRTPRCIVSTRGLHSAPGIQSRRTYKSFAFAITAVFSLAALTYYVSDVDRAVLIIEAPVEDEKTQETSEPEAESEEGPAEEPSPPLGFDDIPPLKYDRNFWMPEGIRTAEEHLEAEGRIYKVHTPCGVPRYDTAFVGHPSPISCFSSASFIELPTHYWVFFGIYDGHNGGKVASYLSQNLRHSIIGTLSDLYSKHATLPDSHIYLGSGPETADYWSAAGLGRPYPPPEEFDAALKQAFLNVDKEIVEDAADHALKAAKLHFDKDPEQDVENLYQQYQLSADAISRVHCGSSAIVAVYESDTRQLRMASTGDSRAVLGRRTVDDRGKETYEVHVLTHEQAIPTGFLTDPVRRRSPGDRPPSVRAFGDGPWKWSTETREQLSSAFPFIVTHEPPFAKATAEPEITSIETQPGDFLVIANHGLWASLTNEEAVGLVALWLKKFGRFVYGSRPTESDEGDDVYDAATSSVIKTFARFPSASTQALLRKDVFAKEDLPVDPLVKDDTFMFRLWQAPKRFVLADKNAAQHLVRNALGGANDDLMETLVRLQLPRGRRFWNDLSVEVVFFN
ncbi:hypothetical protein NP233_g4918 [Leucocoprinus birnbaumii]|uniref:Uncharacterized protein n=1 Tax=Leucocoprinus birnbaumii TaxID=56174 RepID=A0AAD5VTX2_9AGAR|nr:hypothetical protein NP233_g4918 [Leucocoprinus birnbaumii]